MPDKKQIWSWAAYDWANSAFATTVMAGFFPVFFKQFWSAGIDVNRSTLMLGAANSLAGLVVLISAPILGAIADQGSRKKRFLALFAYLGALMTVSLFFLGEGRWLAAAIVYGLGVVGFSGANIFYDALLPLVAGEDRVDVVSGLGFACGYLGGGLLFLLNVLMTQQPAWFGLANAAQGIRWSFLTVGIWWAVFTLPLLVWVREKKAHPEQRGSVLAGFRQVGRTFRHIRRLRTTFLFLVAYWLYIDGVDTIIRMAVDFGMSIGFDAADLILALLITQFVGFPSAICFGKLGERWGAKKGILVGIGVYLGVTLYGTAMSERYEFYILAVTIGLVQGGVQALSRSLYARFVPPGQEAEFFGFYNMLGKFAAIIGPVMIGVVGVAARAAGLPAETASRIGIGSIAVLFVLGGLILLRVDVDEGRRSVGRVIE